MTNPPTRLQRFLADLKRRHVFKVAAVYGAAAFAVMQAADFLVPALRLPDVVATVIALVSILGLPVVLVLAWAFEWTPDGVRRERSATGDELETIAAQPRARRWPAGVLALAGIALVVAGGWWVLVRAPGTGEGNATGGSGATVDRRSIAVLPFTNMSGNPENEYFSDGITDDIITHLSRLSDMKVISRTSAMRFRDVDRNLREIAAELGVATILEGGVQRSGERVRINAQLIDAATDEHLWAEQYNRELTDVFAVQTDVALQIAAALEAQLSADERGQLERQPTENIEAYNLYLQGRYFWNKRTREGLETASEYFERAIALDPDYALAWVGVADSYSILAEWGYVSLDEALGTAAEAASRALQIDETLGEAHIAQAQIRTVEWDWTAAEAGFVRGLELSPGYATGHQWYGTLLGTIGRDEEGFRELELARELDPLSLIIIANTGMLLGIVGRFDEAETVLRRALDLDPDFIGALQEIGYILEATSRFDEAIEVYRRAIELSGGLIGYAESGHVYGVMGRHSDALDRLATLEEEAKTRYVAPADFGIVHAGLGNTDLAFDYFEEGFRQRDPTLKWRILSPQLANLRPDPRMVDLMDRMGIGSR